MRPPRGAFVPGPAAFGNRYHAVALENHSWQGEESKVKYFRLPAHISQAPRGPGSLRNPAYEDVCTGTTGHAEVVQITFDPKIVSFRELLDVFFVIHDPTTLNRQGNDTGTQYRSIILYSSEAQKAAAEKSKAEAQKHFRQPIVTEIVPLKRFYPAEDYHQDYYRANPNQPYCRAVIRPKVEKFEKKLKAAQH